VTGRIAHVANPDHVNLVQAGPGAVLEWRAANAEARLDLAGADLLASSLEAVDLSGADLRGATLSHSRLAFANLSGSDLREADLRSANLALTILEGADLRGARLDWIGFIRSRLAGANLAGATLGGNAFVTTDLAEAKGLDAVVHLGPTSIDLDTLARFRGKAPETFLRGCGYAAWQVMAHRLEDPSLSDAAIAELSDRLYRLRARSPLGVGGLFISYAHGDARDLADRLREVLAERGVSVWLDRHEMKAGSVARQLERAMRSTDAVVLILSAGSVRSDWIEYELSLAREKEKAERREVLCPVALDESWNDPASVDHIDPVLLYQLKKRFVVDFSGWAEPQGFEEAFRRLWDGLKLYFRPSV
jgi:uncharacterized protein YjbI with pentapeptide repeats